MGLHATNACISARSAEMTRETMLQISDALPAHAQKLLTGLVTAQTYEEEQMSEELKLDGTETPELRSCPFCGKEPIVTLISSGWTAIETWPWVVSCENPDCDRCPSTDHHISKDFAIEAWNTGQAD